MSEKNQNVHRLVGTAVLAAVIVVLQLTVGGVRVGPFTITLALIPIILGAVLYGPAVGAGLGGVFGLVVCYAVVTGIDAGGFLMYQQNPFVTLFVCVLKSTVAGFVAGAVYRLCASKGKELLGIILAAVVCPVCNTGILCIAMVTVFHELVSGWAIAAGSASLFGYIIAGVVGVNFLIELTVDIVLAPVFYRVLKAVRRD